MIFYVVAFVLYGCTYDFFHLPCEIIDLIINDFPVICHKWNVLRKKYNLPCIKLLLTLITFLNSSRRGSIMHIVVTMNTKFLRLKVNVFHIECRQVVIILNILFFWNSRKMPFSRNIFLHIHLSHIVNRLCVNKYNTKLYHNFLDTKKCKDIWKTYHRKHTLSMWVGKKTFFFVITERWERS